LRLIVDEWRSTMATCDVCGNDDDRRFGMRHRPVSYTFDCFANAPSTGWLRSARTARAA